LGPPQRVFLLKGKSIKGDLKEHIMPDLPNGRYGVTVSWAFSYSGILDTNANPPTYQGNAVSNFSATNGSIGWTVTINNVSVTFSTGTYNAGPPATVTGGTASASGMQNGSWNVLALPNGHYLVTAKNNNSSVGGKLVVSGQPGSQSATYQFGGVGQPQNCSSLDLTSGQIGWVVTDTSGTTYTFSNGVYIPLQGEPNLIFSGHVVFPTTFDTDDTWTADSTTGDPKLHANVTYRG
jgi:hypothetical protein